MIVLNEDLKDGSTVPEGSKSCNGLARGSVSILDQKAVQVLRDVGWTGPLPVDPVRIASCFGIKVVVDDTLVGSSTSGYRLRDENGEKYIVLNSQFNNAIRRNTVA